MLLKWENMSVKDCTSYESQYFINNIRFLIEKVGQKFELNLYYEIADNLGVEEVSTISIGKYKTLELAKRNAQMLVNIFAYIFANRSCDLLTEYLAKDSAWQ